MYFLVSFSNVSIDTSLIRVMAWEFGKCSNRKNGNGPTMRTSSQKPDKPDSFHGNFVLHCRPSESIRVCTAYKNNRWFTFHLSILSWPCQIQCIMPRTRLSLSSTQLGRNLKSFQGLFPFRISLISPGGNELEVNSDFQMKNNHLSYFSSIFATKRVRVCNRNFYAAANYYLMLTRCCFYHSPRIGSFWHILKAV